MDPLYLPSLSFLRRVPASAPSLPLNTSPSSSISLQFISFYPNADFFQDAANVFRFLLFFHSLILFSLCVGKLADPGVGGGCY